MLKNFTIRFSLVIIYLILSANFIISKENNNLLIINSYNNNVTWSGSLVDSILNSIHKVENNINIEVLNLNLNEFISEEQASNTIEFTLKNTNNLPGNIIIIGDDALDAYNKTTYYNNNNIKTIVVSNYNNKVSNNNQIKVGYPIPVNQNIEIIRYFSNYDEIIYIEKDSPLARKTFESIKKEANANNLTENIKAIFINKKNLDSLYNIITENSKINRVIITSMWDFTDPHSLLTSTQEDSILIRSNIPIITLMPNSFSNTHIVGGYNLSIKFCSDKIIDILKKIYSGAELKSIPYEEVKNGALIINKKAITKLSLPDITKYYFETETVNRNDNFIIKYKYYLAILLLILVLILILIVIIHRNRKKNREILQNVTKSQEREQVTMYLTNGENENFIIYNEAGEMSYKIFEKKYETVLNNDKLNDIFKNTFLSDQEINDLRSKKNIIKVIELNDLLFQINLKPIARNNNENYKYLATINDISEFSEELKNNDIYKDIIGSATLSKSIGIASYNILTGEGFATNNWYTNLCEQKHLKFLLPTYENISEEDKLKITNFLKDCKEGKGKLFSLDINVKDETLGDKWIKEIILIDKYNLSKDIVNIIEFNYDITKDKKSENELINLKKDALDNLSDTNNFINNLNHALRIPLTSILGFANTLSDINDSNEREEIIKIIKKNNEQLIEIINNVLFICKLDSNNYTFNYSKFCLNELFKEFKIATEFMINADKPGSKIEVILDIPNNNHFLESDENSFKLVMVNILANAVSYTNRGSIELGFHSTDNGYNFYIKDTGVGISEDFKKIIFNKFEKGENSNGTGLGLSIAKSIVTKLGGKIGVISSEGKGSTFWFTLK